MRKIQIIAIITCLLLVMAENIEADNKIKSLPRDLEIQMALSSLPSHLRKNATVYVLDPDTGFEVARKGSNGFHAFVDRIDPAAFRGSWPYTEYRDDMLVPISFDSAGAKEHMRLMMDAAKMRAEGTQAAELKKTINQRFKTGHYGPPERTGISYMLSPILRAYQHPDNSDAVTTINYPHYMFYAPGVSNEDVGGQMLSPHLFIINQGPHGYMIKAVGLTEKAVINKEYEEMIKKLCDLRTEYCLPKQSM